MAELRHILYAEDDERDIELTLHALHAAGLANRVDVVRDGQEAMDYLSKTTELPIVAILDLKMPKVDGIEVLRAMKASERLRGVPVVMLTSSRQERDLVVSYRLGVNAYVVKPIDFQEFVAAVRSIGVFWALVNQTPDRMPPAT